MKARPAGLRAGVLVDTGPLVALLNGADRHHRWAVAQLAEIEPPLITCEAVLTEASHLVRQLPRGRTALMEMVDETFLTIGLQIAAESAPLLALVKRYASVPMSLADACMVRLAEMNPQGVVWTLDSDFSVYRKNARHVIPLLSPVPSTR